LAGTGKAHPESLIRAINMANSMVRNHSKGNFKDFRI
jgi:4-hydroxy-L-threonine phosphate dehydrogenase PdxA